MKTTGSFVASASKIDNKEVADDSTGNGNNIDRLDILKKSTKFKSQNLKCGKLVKNSNIMEELKFLTFKAKEVFNYLKQAFTKEPIFQYFDLKCYTRIKTNASDYTIERVLKKLNSN